MLTPRDVAQLRRTYRDPSVASIEIAAPAEQVMAVVADPSAMAEVGAEIYRVQMMEGAEPAVGGRFKGFNRRGPRRWSTVCTITDMSPSRFGYEVFAPAPLGNPIARWQYDVEPVGDGSSSRVTETAWAKVPLWFIPIGVATTGILNRPAYNTRHAEQTLQRLKAKVETATS